MTTQTPTKPWIFDDTDALTKAMGRAVRDAVRLHKKLGVTISTVHDGKVVIIQPEDIAIEEEE